MLIPPSVARAGDDALARHERASSWNTVVVPEPPARKTPTPPAQTYRAGVTTASLSANSPHPAGAQSHPNHRDLTGLASFYWQGTKTANGEAFDKTALTAAHRTLPFNTRVKVTHLANGRSVIVRINDRGPFKPGRIIDLSHAAAGALDMHGQGLARVKIEVLD